jgi:hypothetical protein
MSVLVVSMWMSCGQKGLTKERLAAPVKAELVGYSLLPPPEPPFFVPATRFLAS